MPNKPLVWLGSGPVRSPPFSQDARRQAGWLVEAATERRSAFYAEVQAHAQTLARAAMSCASTTPRPGRPGASSTESTPTRLSSSILSQRSCSQRRALRLLAQRGASGSTTYLQTRHNDEARETTTARGPRAGSSALQKTSSISPTKMSSTSSSISPSRLF